MTIISKTEDLEIMLAVVDCGGFSAAAKQLDVQVAKVSRAISRLEQSLNCTLFNRTTRRVELTEEGRIFNQSVRAGLSSIAEAEENLSNLRGTPSGRLRVDAASPFILHQLVPLVSGFNEAYPRITLELISNENIIDLIEKRTDVAIRIGELRDSNLHARSLGRSRLHLVASQHYLKKHGRPKSTEDLHQHNIIGFAESPKLNDWPLVKKIDLQPSVSASSGETLRQLCLAGNGIALLSNFMIEDDLNQGLLVPVLEDSISSPNSRELVQAVYYRNSVLAPRISVFLNYIAEKIEL